MSVAASAPASPPSAHHVIVDQVADGRRGLVPVVVVLLQHRLAVLVERAVVLGTRVAERVHVARVPVDRAVE